MGLRWRLATVVLILVLLPLWTSILVRTYGWIVILQRKGLLNQALRMLLHGWEDVKGLVLRKNGSSADFSPHAKPRAD